MRAWKVEGSVSGASSVPQLASAWRDSQPQSAWLEDELYIAIYGTIQYTLRSKCDSRFSSIQF
jgi:hypothetical protein